MAKVELERADLWDECSSCSGSGSYHYEAKDVMRDCPVCDGEGEVPSEFGLAIIELIDMKSRFRT